MRLDPFDRKILAELQREGRQTVAQLATRVGLSESPCLRRLRRLEEEGYIEGYQSVLNRTKLGLGVMGFVQVAIHPHRAEDAERFKAAIAAVPEIVECHSVSGEFDFLLVVVAESLDAYSRFVNAKLLSTLGVIKIQTSFALGAVKPFAGLPVGAG